MRKKKFYSQLFQREILPTEEEFFSKVYGELLYRIHDIETKNCDCTQCMKELIDYKNTIKKLNELRKQKNAQ